MHKCYVNGVGVSQCLSTPNILDDVESRTFKKRVRARQESVNSQLKHFKILTTKFRHALDKHQLVFYALCVLLQEEFRAVSPLYDV